MIARDVERFLSETPRTHSRIYFAEDFENPVKAPDDLVTSPKHFRNVPDGLTRSIPISYEHQAFLTRPGTEGRQLSDDYARLSKLLPLHKELERRLGDILFWQYVSLESGVHASYPGHGGYPPGYDPQTRPWYILAKERNGLAWNTPYFDASTRQVIMTTSMPVYHPDASFAGVVAIDVLLAEVLQLGELSSQWSPAMRSFLIWRGHRKETGESGLWVVARKDYVENAAAWSGVMGMERLASTDAVEMARLEEEIKTHSSGYLDMPYYGVDSIWAYAHAGENVYLMLIVPKKIVLAQLEQVRKSLHTLIREQWLLTGFAAAALVFLLILAAVWFARAMIRPLFNMVNAVQRLAKGDFSARIDIETGDERDLLAKSFNQMVPQLQERVQMRKALEVAKEVQQNLLPRDIPALRGFDIVATSVYCDETGGDYFDFFPCGEEDCGRFGIVVGDGTGHGVGAALLMATVRALIRGLLTKPENLAHCLAEVNRHVVADVRQTGSFVSLFCLIIDDESPHISWVRAGHDPAILYDPTSRTFEELMGPGMVLGVEEEYPFKQVDKRIEAAGTIILVGTDGIWETHNGEGELFGKYRLQQVIRENADRTARDIQDAVLFAIDDFRGSVPQHDDITIVVIKTI
jgi:sigma-B regulation protein RsbU (phosphoserine phosphatase)